MRLDVEPDKGDKDRGRSGISSKAKSDESDDNRAGSGYSPK